jgi:hypothetical protein
MQLAQRVSVQYHLVPLDKKETREYITYRLARAGGSGIFTDSALELLYDYTQGVPRRLNNLCDLALVAGFAEGRREIDGEFLATVLAAQGLSLETLEPPEELRACEPQAEYRVPAEPGSSRSDDGVGLAVAELASRLSRLEGIVLELSGQMLPVLRRLLGKQEPPDADHLLAAESSAPFLSDEETDAADAAETTPDLSTSTPPAPRAPRQGWWARIWGRG